MRFLKKTPMQEAEALERAADMAREEMTPRTKKPFGKLLCSGDGLLGNGQQASTVIRSAPKTLCHMWGNREV